MKRSKSIILLSMMAMMLSACENTTDTSEIALRTAAEECRRQIEVGLPPELITSCNGLDIFITGGTLNNDNPLIVAMAEAEKGNEIIAEKRNTQNSSSSGGMMNPALVWIYHNSYSTPISHTASAPSYSRSQISQIGRSTSYSTYRSSVSTNGFGRAASFNSTSS